MIGRSNVSGGGKFEIFNSQITTIDSANIQGTIPKHSFFCLNQSDTAIMDKVTRDSQSSGAERSICSINKNEFLCLTTREGDSYLSGYLSKYIFNNDNDRYECIYIGSISLSHWPTRSTGGCDIFLNKVDTYKYIILYQCYRYPNYYKGLMGITFNEDYTTYTTSTPISLDGYNIIFNTNCNKVSSMLRPNLYLVYGTSGSTKQVALAKIEYTDAVNIQVGTMVSLQYFSGILDIMEDTNEAYVISNDPNYYQNYLYKITWDNNLNLSTARLTSIYNSSDQRSIRAENCIKVAEKTYVIKLNTNSTYPSYIVMKIKSDDTGVDLGTEVSAQVPNSSIYFSGYINNRVLSTEFPQISGNIVQCWLNINRFDITVEQISGGITMGSSIACNNTETAICTIARGGDEYAYIFYVKFDYELKNGILYGVALDDLSSTKSGQAYILNK